LGTVTPAFPLDIRLRLTTAAVQASCSRTLAFPQTLAPMLVKRAVHAGAGAYGFLNAATVAGALLGGLLRRPLIRRLSVATAVAGGLAAVGFAAALADRWAPGAIA
jgi:hypothetical protein